MRLGAVLLAAGASSRMGRPKQLLPWGSTTILGHLIQVWRTLGADQIAVVHNPLHPPILRELDRLGCSEANRIPNPRADRGMFSSIQCAAAWSDGSPALTHYALVLGDQPQVAVETLRPLLQFAAKNAGKICQPGYHGRPRHPVISPSAIFAELAGAKENHLKDFLRNRSGQVALLEMEDPALDFDLDTPEDYAHALRTFGGPSEPT